MSRLKEWAIEGGALVKDYQFKDFKEAMVFVNKVADTAEKINHHPDIIIGYNFVRLTVITHSERGLTDKDFILAEDIDKLS